MSRKYLISLCITLIMCISFSTTTLAISEPSKSMQDGQTYVKLFFPTLDGNYKQVDKELPAEMEKQKEYYAISMLFDKNNVPENAFTEIPNGIKINSVIIEGSLATIDISGEFLSKISANTNIPIIIDSITKTLFAFDYIDEVFITFDGNVVEDINGWVMNLPFPRPVIYPFDENAKQFAEKTKDMTVQEILQMLKNPDNIPLISAGITAAGGKTVYIDAGHGGSDPGTSGILTGTTYYEKDLNLAIAKACRDTLQQVGFTVYMRRTTDTYTNFNDIAPLANATNSTAFVSVHCNASGNTSVHGSEFYYPAYNQGPNPFGDRMSKSVDFASYIGEACKDKLPYWGTNPKSGNFAVLNNTNMYAVLVECGYMSNQGDLAYLVTSGNQIAYGQDIAGGIIGFFYNNGWY